jgi:hypothetical protein
MADQQGGVYALGFLYWAVFLNRKMSHIRKHLELTGIIRMILEPCSLLRNKLGHFVYTRIGFCLEVSS